jgi:hypothetical protein
MFDFNKALENTHPEFYKFDKRERNKFTKRTLYTMVLFITYAILAYFSILPFYVAIGYLATALVFLWGLIFLVKELLWVMSCDLDNISV